MLHHERAAIPHIDIELDEHTQLFPPNYGNDIARLNYFPDESPTLISALNAKPCRFLLVAADKTYLMERETPETAQPVRMVLGPSRSRGFDNDYSGITSVYREPTTDTLLGFYHAETKHGTPFVVNDRGKRQKATYWSIGLAISDDDRNIFSSEGPILSPSIPKKQITHVNQGIGDVCVIENGSGDYLYAYYTDITRRPESFPAGIALARCRTTEARNPKAWHKCSNVGTGEFNGDALEGMESPVVLKDECEVSQPHVTYLGEALGYVMVCCVLGNSDYCPRTTEHSGIFLYHSADGLKWKEQQRLFDGYPIPINGVSYTAHPSLYLPIRTRTTAEGCLLYCFSDRWRKNLKDRDGQPHYMCYRRIRVTLRN